MRNKQLFLINVLLILFILNSCAKHEYKRIRIVAESNDASSYEEKIIIKDTLKQLFDQGILTYNSINVKIIYETLEKSLENILFEKLTIEECYSNYELKTYRDKIIPSGCYETILITIGEGKGHNFWTIIYPEYFGLEFEENNEVEFRSYLYDLFNKKGVKNENIHWIRPCWFSFKRKSM